jgi:hypothetical protein
LLLREADTNPAHAIAAVSAAHETIVVVRRHENNDDDDELDAPVANLSVSLPPNNDARSAATMVEPIQKSRMVLLRATRTLSERALLFAHRTTRLDEHTKTRVRAYVRVNDSRAARARRASHSPVDARRAVAGTPKHNTHKKPHTD